MKLNDFIHTSYIIGKLENSRHTIRLHMNVHMNIPSLMIYLKTLQLKNFYGCNLSIWLLTNVL